MLKWKNHHINKKNPNKFLRLLPLLFGIWESTVKYVGHKIGLRRIKEARRIDTYCGGGIRCVIAEHPTLWQFAETISKIRSSTLSNRPSIACQNGRIAANIKNKIKEKEKRSYKHKSPNNFLWRLLLLFCIWSEQWSMQDVGSIPRWGGSKWAEGE